MNSVNAYIQLKKMIEDGGGSVPQELIDQVEALDTTVNGDETQDPPIIGLVDIVGDLENEVEELDTTVNGDETQDPPIPGLNDRVSNIETALGKTTLGSAVNISSYTTDPYTTLTDGYVRISGTSGEILLGNATLLSASGSGMYASCYVKAGSKVKVSGSPTTAHFMPLS